MTVFRAPIQNQHALKTMTMTQVLAKFENALQFE